MNTHKLPSLLQRHKLFLPGVALALACILAWGITPGRAQDSAQEGAAASAPEEREVEDKIPPHLPIKVKVKKPEKIKDLKNENWLGDLEIEVKNTGEKPIYFLSISLFFIDVKRDSGDQIGYPLRYGRPELIDIQKRPTPDDVPIQPGETHVFKMSESYIKGWDWYRTKVEKKPHPKKVGIRFQVLSHGDGTGYHTSGGLPVPSIPRKKSFVEGNSSKVGIIAVKGCNNRSPDSFLQSSIFFLPASFKPVNFFPAKAPKISLEATSPQTCCPGTTCTRMKEVFGGNCFCDNDGDGEVDLSFSTEVDYGCNDPFADCGTQRNEFSECGSGETYHTCTNFFVDPCGTPTPEPTPTPAPTPPDAPSCPPPKTPVYFAGQWVCVCPPSPQQDQGCSPETGQV